MQQQDFDYDFLVIGGGSGGVRASRVAAGLGARVALVADNPGVWMFHCHVIDHMETGLMAAIAVG